MNNINKHAALRLMASGRATIAEIAKITGVSRQSARQWAVDANLDVTTARRAFLMKLWQRLTKGQNDRQRIIRRSSDPTSLDEISYRLTLLRRALGHKQVVMGRLMGTVSNGQAWGNYEAGRRRISVDHALKLHQTCGVPIDWIYRGEHMHMMPPDLRDKIQKIMALEVTRL